MDPLKNNKACPCGVTTWPSGTSGGAHCNKCGRTFVNYSDGNRWEPDPAVEAVARLERMGQGHFLVIERQLQSLKRQVDRLRAELPKRRKK